MNKFGKKGFAAFLTAAMLVTNISAVSMAEDMTQKMPAEGQTEAVTREAQGVQTPEAQAEAAEPKAEAPTEPQAEAPTEKPTEAPTEKPTEAPTEKPTEAPTEKPTEAPTEKSTEAPTEKPTEAPTEKPTEAPTEKPTEAPTEKPTEAPTEKPTEKPTEAPTEKPTEAPTEKPTEKPTEAPTEKPTEADPFLYTVEEKEYTVSVKVPEDLILPEGTALIAKALKEDADTYENDLLLAQKKAGHGFEEYQIYDLHFEADGKEVTLEERSKADIEVTLTFDNTAFKAENLKKEDMKVFHIKDMTPQELEEAKAADAAHTDTQKAEELKTDVTFEEENGKVRELTFKTDGFSDYVLTAGVKELESESETGAENESAGEAGTEEKTEDAAGSEKESESETESEMGIEAEAEGEEENEPEVKGNIGLPPVAPRRITKLEIALSVKGAVPETDAPEFYEVKVKAEEVDQFDASGVKVTGEATGNNADGPEYSYDEADRTLTVKVKAPEAGAISSITITDLPEEVTYTILADGNYLDENGMPAGTKAYSTIYNEKSLTPPTVNLTEDVTVGITNLYTEARLVMFEKGREDAGVKAAFFALMSGSGETAVPVTGELVGNLTTDENGRVSIKGLVPGSYTVKTETIPMNYVDIPQTAAFEISASNPVTEELKFQVSPIRVKVQAVDSETKKVLTDAEFKVKGTDFVLNSENQFTLSGALSRLTRYEIEQTKVPYGYVSNVFAAFTLKNTASVQVVRISNRPTIVNVSVVSKSTGDMLKGAGFEIRNSKGQVVEGCKWTSTNEPFVLKAKLQAGQKYKLVQTSVPDGYLKAATKEFTVSASKTTAIKVTNDTTKVSISRKGYDSKVQGADGKVQYTNRKMLSGAVLEVQDLNGTVIESWTSSEEPHIIEGKLAAGTKYKLVEKTTPNGYEKGGSGEFMTKTDGSTAIVTMQTRKASGKIQVAMRASLKGSAIKLNKTFYCALFLDEGKTQMYEGGVKPIRMTADAVYATVMFEDVPAGIYYVAETDENGNVIREGNGYTISYTNEKMVLASGRSLIAEIVNDYAAAPDGGYKEVTGQELKQSYQQEYQNYGGSRDASVEMASGDGAVQTGDTTNIMLYVGLLAAAVLLLIAAVFLKKRNRK